MRVGLFNHNMGRSPMSLLANIARVCKNTVPLDYFFKYSPNAGVSEYQAERDLKRVCELLEYEHYSVFRHITLSFIVSGLSRAALAQLTRHQVGITFSVQSQRYVKYNPASDAWDNLVLPKLEYMGTAKAKLAMEIIDKHCNDVEVAYTSLTGLGVKAEDARGVLNNMFPTNLIMTVNLHAFLVNIFPLRTSDHAQSEIATLMTMCMDSLKEKSVGMTEFFKFYSDWLSRKRVDNPSWYIKLDCKDSDDDNSWD